MFFLGFLLRTTMPVSEATKKSSTTSGPTTKDLPPPHQA